MKLKQHAQHIFIGLYIASFGTILVHFIYENYQFKPRQSFVSYLLGYDSLKQYLYKKTFLLKQVVSQDSVESPAITVVLNNPWSKPENVSIKII